MQTWIPNSPPRPTIRTLKAAETWFSAPMAAAAKALPHVGVDPAVARQTSQAFEVSAGGAED